MSPLPFVLAVMIVAGTLWAAITIKEKSESCPWRMIGDVEIMRVEMRTCVDAGNVFQIKQAQGGWKFRCKGGE